MVDSLYPLKVEVMSLTTIGSEPQPNLAWTFESSNVDYVTNLSPSSQVSPGPAQLQGSAALVTTVAGVSNTAVYFPNSTTSYMDIGTNGPVNFNTSTSNLFVEAWVYFNSTGTPFTPIIVAGVSPAGGATENWGLAFNGSIMYFYFISATTGGKHSSNTAVLNSGTWYHVGGSWDVTTQTLRCFVNGYVGSVTATCTDPRNTANSKALIGQFTDLTRRLDGYIRDLRVVQGGVVPTTSFTPGAAPFSYSLPSYVTGSGSTVFTLLGQFITYNPSGKFGSSLVLLNPKVGGSSNIANTSVQWTTTQTSNAMTGVTISYWINFYAIPPNDVNLRGLIFKYGDLYTTTYGTSLSQGMYDGSVYPGAVNTFNPTVGTWYHLTHVYGNGLITSYVNGYQLGSSASFTQARTVTNSVLRIASETFLTFPSSFQMDDLRIYNTALTAAQVQSIYTQGGAPASSFRVVPQPRLAWDFNGTTTSYIGGLAPNTTIGTPVYVSGKYGQAIQFINSSRGGNSNAASNALTFSTTPISSSNAYIGLTIAIWVNTTQFPYLGDQSYIVLWGDTAIVHQYNGVNQSLATFTYNPVLGNYPGVNYVFSPTLGTWYHYCVVCNNGTLTQYINGAQTGTAIVPNARTLTTPALWVGHSGYDRPFNGLIDDLRIYDTALSAAQVQSIYRAQGMPNRGVQTLSAPLDSLSASGAYSTRLLRSAYNGPVVKVRRNSDNAELDFIADKFGNLSNVQNAVMIDTWLASTTGNVTTWYDQAYSNNFTQSTASAQPQIVKNGGKWVLFFNRDSTPTFYSNLQLTTSQTGIYSVIYNSNLLGTYSFWQTLLGQAGNDNRGFRFNNNTIYGDALASGGRYGQDFLAAAGAYWYLNGLYGNMTAGAPGVASVVNPNGNNGTYTNGVWNHIIGVANGGMETFQFNSINAPLSSLLFRTAYGYLAELILFKTQLNDSQARSLYTNQYISRSLNIYTGTPLFSQLSASATSSAVGAFSLRAVNGTSARAVKVRPVAAFPPVGMTSASIQSVNQFTQTLSGYAFGGAGTYTANCSSFAGDVNQPHPWKAFDYDTSTWWENNYVVQSGYNGIGATSANTYNGSYTTTVSGSSIGGEWLQLGFPTPIVLHSYSMYTRTGYNGYRMPYAWVIAGSNDGTTWTTVDTETGIIWTGATQTFTTTSSTPYLYFRMIVQAIQSNGNINQPVNIGQWTLNGSNALWQTDFYADRLGNLLTAPVSGQTLANWLGGATGYVTTWYDQSGAGNHASQSTAANQPIIQRATKGPGYMVNFNGTSQFVTLSASYDFLNGTNITVNAVALRTATVTSPNYIIGTNSPTASYQRFFLGFGSDTSINMPVTGAPTAITIPAYNASSEPVTYMTGGLIPSRVLYTNDTLTGTNIDTNLLSVPSGYSYSIGYTVGASTYYYLGNLFELLIFTSALDQTQITRVYQNQLGYTGT